MKLSLQSNDYSKVGDYFVKLDVTFSSLPAVTFRNDDELHIRLKPSCKADGMNSPKWILTNTVTIASS